MLTRQSTSSVWGIFSHLRLSSLLTRLSRWSNSPVKASYIPTPCRTWEVTSRHRWGFTHWILTSHSSPEWWRFPNRCEFPRNTVNVTLKTLTSPVDPEVRLIVTRDVRAAHQTATNISNCILYLRNTIIVISSEYYWMFIMDRVSASVEKRVSWLPIKHCLATSMDYTRGTSIDEIKTNDSNGYHYNDSTVENLIGNSLVSRVCTFYEGV